MTHPSARRVEGCADVVGCVGAGTNGHVLEYRVLECQLVSKVHLTFTAIGGRYQCCEWRPDIPIDVSELAKH